MKGKAKLNFKLNKKNNLKVLKEERDNLNLKIKELNEKNDELNIRINEKEKILIHKKENYEKENNRYEKIIKEKSI